MPTHTPPLQMSYSARQPAQDRLKRLQSILKKVDKVEKPPKHLTSRSSLSRNKRIESNKSILSVLTNDGPSTSACAAQRNNKSSKLANTERVASSSKSPFQSQHSNGTVRNVTLPAAAATNSSSSTINTNTKTTKLSQENSKNGIIGKFRNYYSELKSLTESYTTDANNATTSATATINAMRQPTQLRNVETTTKSRFGYACKKLRNTWEKPKALTDSIKKLNNKRPATGMSSNQASNERLRKLRATLQKNQSTNSGVDAASTSLNMVRTASPAMPSAALLHSAQEVSTQECISLMRLLSELDCEPMDWQPMNEEVLELPPEPELAQVPSTDDDEDTVNDLYDFTSDTSDDPYENYEDAISESGAGGDTQRINVRLGHTNKTNVSIEAKSREVAALPLTTSSSSAHNEQQLMRTIMNDIVAQLNRDDETNATLPKWKLDNLYFVLDTNVLLNYLIFVEELTQVSLCDTAGGMLYIPFVVIRELDNLKDRDGNESIRLKAIRAIRYLNTKFDESHDIQAQSALAEKEHLIDVQSPDDSIVNCCLQLRNAVQHMMLLTDDGNLRLKARASGIVATTKSDLIAKYPEKFVALHAP